jgi:hypothetical protein
MRRIWGRYCGRFQISKVLCMLYCTFHAKAVVISFHSLNLHSAYGRHPRSDHVQGDDLLDQWPFWLGTCIACNSFAHIIIIITECALKVLCAHWNSPPDATHHQICGASTHMPNPRHRIPPNDDSPAQLSEEKVRSVRRCRRTTPKRQAPNPRVTPVS